MTATATRLDWATTLSDWLILDEAYGIARVDAAIARGWNPLAHVDALLAGDVDAISLTHPYNHLTEEEVEA